jgi:putative methyltransferase (TIGR04325 family)
MKSTKAIAKDLLPPILTRQLLALRKNILRFEGVYSNWTEASHRSKGYDEYGILDKVLAATLKVKKGEAAYDRDSMVFDEAEYVWPLLSAVMWAAAQNKGHLSVLDFGGALGSSYFQHKRFLDRLTDVRWNIVEQNHFVESGNSLIADGEDIKFYPNIDLCLEEQTPTVVLLSSVLQYLPDPIEILRRLSEIGASVMLIDRTPLSNTKYHSLTIQHVPATIYEASYPMWIFSEALLQQCIEKLGWKIVSRFPGPEEKTGPRPGIKFNFEGLLLEKC